MVRSPISARQIIYGRCKTAGTIVYISTTGTKNEYLHLVVALAGHEIQEIGDVYFNDEVVLTGSGDGGATGKYAGKATFYKHLGANPQTADAALITATSGLTDGKWTSAHRLDGVAYIYAQLIWDAEVYVGGIPNISCIVKGKKVYDPRTAGTAYSANPALCLRDYITDTALGMGMTSAEIDDTSVTAAANVCDEQVQILPASPVIYENRYDADGVLVTSAAPDENIGKLLSAMGGLIAYSGGKIVMYAAAYRTPTVTLTEKHLAGPISVTTRISARDRVNAVKGVYVSEDNNWTVSDFPAIVSATYLAADNNVRYWRDVVLPFTVSASCAQRKASITRPSCKVTLMLASKRAGKKCGSKGDHVILFAKSSTSLRGTETKESRSTRPSIICNATITGKLQRTAWPVCGFCLSVQGSHTIEAVGATAQPRSEAPCPKPSSTNSAQPSTACFRSRHGVRQRSSTTWGERCRMA
ncbi:MAG: hypothetical protein EBV45_08350 [Chloroflexi bacterium]|nr:hypothetical protein [Chloroflexota bacterium]